MAVNNRVEFVEETGGRQSTPAFVPQRFVPGATATATDILRTGGAGKQGGYPVTKLNPRRRGLRDGAIFASDVKDLGPEPFAGVDAADIARVVFFTRRVAQAGDGLRLLHRGVIFPQHEHGIRVVSEFFAQRQHVSVCINRRRG